MTKKTNSWERIFIWLDKIIYLYTAGETLEAKKEEKTFRKYLEVNFIPKEEVKNILKEQREEVREIIEEDTIRLLLIEAFGEWGAFIKMNEDKKVVSGGSKITEKYAKKIKKYLLKRIK